MRPQRIAHLSDRGAVSVTGADAAKLLQGLITNDIEATNNLTATGRPCAIHAGLLSPQGKILFDFFVAIAPDGFVLDVGLDKASDLVQRLTMYKLRADVAIADVTANYKVLALWGKDACSSGETVGTVAFDDPRLSDMGLRILAETRFATDIASATNGVNVLASEYHAHRISLGVPEGGKDYDFGGAYPHEANFDMFNGVSFTKGCYVGQEIVARMQHKTAIKKRVVKVSGSEALHAGAEMRFGEAPIGRIGSVDGKNGLAMLRLDRAAEAKDKGLALTAYGIAVTPDAAAMKHYRSSAAAQPTAPELPR